MSLYVCAGTAHDLARRALAARLYVPTGALVHCLEEIADEYRLGCTVGLLTDGTHDFGVGLVNNDGQVSVYVASDARGKGWGEKLVQLVKIAHPDQSLEWFALPSDNATAGARFWKRCGIPLRSHGLAPPMTAAERKRFTKDRRVLIDRQSDNVTMDVYETLYIEQLYGDDYSELHDGIRGKLHYIFEENIAPFDHLLFHYAQGYESCAMLTERGDGRVELQLYVRPEYRRKGLGQQIIDRAKELYPEQPLYGYHTETSTHLLTRNEILDLKRTPE
ncbi:hypothetical protein LUCX_229 [Xanthomonas phage vB_XciM_LucasX]|nr:hypothetical protein LUCX_229 [Xanthomonas phage vB_XciM_LucasX]